MISFLDISSLCISLYMILSISLLWIASYMYAGFQSYTSSADLLLAYFYMSSYKWKKKKMKGRNSHWKLLPF